MALAANALTTLADAKEYLKIDPTDTSKDALIESLINAVSDQIEKYCNRRLKEQTYTDQEYDGTGSQTLMLREYPISSVTEVKIDDVPIDSSEYKIRKDIGALVRLNSCWPEGIQNIKVTFTAGYNPVPADLELACKHLVKFYYEVDIADFSKTFAEGFVLRPEAIPPQIKMLLSSYRKVLI